MRVVLALCVHRASVFSFYDHSQCIGLMLMSVDSGHLRDTSVDGNIILTLMSEDVDWTPVNSEYVYRIFDDGSEREGCIRYWNFLTTNDMEDKYNRRIIKQR